MLNVLNRKNEETNRNHLLSAGSGAARETEEECGGNENNEVPKEAEN